MSPLRHAAAWFAAIVGAASFTAALAHPADLEPLAQRWQAQLVASLGHARALHLASAMHEASLQQLPALLALRVATLCAWLWLLVPLWIAAALQGWAIADARRAAFAASNPALHRLACHAAISVAGAILVALSLPVDLPAASVPAGGVVVALLVAWQFSHRPAWRG
jgi:hypothetical protein